MNIANSITEISITGNDADFNTKNIKINITTIEDPVEIKLEGVNQSQVNAKAGITFAFCMRAILRQDPDIILVG